MGETGRRGEAAPVHVVTEALPSVLSAGEAAQEPSEGVAVGREGGDPDERISRNRPRSSPFRYVRVKLEQGKDAHEGSGTPRGRLPGSVAGLARQKLVVAEALGRSRQIRGDDRAKEDAISKEERQRGVGGRVRRLWLVHGRAVLMRPPAERELSCIFQAPDGLAVPEPAKIREGAGPVSMLSQQETTSSERSRGG